MTAMILLPLCIILKIIRKSLLEAFRDPHFNDIRVLICADGHTGLQSVYIKF